MSRFIKIYLFIFDCIQKMSYLGPICGIIIFYSSMIYYIIHRFFILFGGSEHKVTIGIISGILGLLLSLSFFLSIEGKYLDILGTLSGWIFVFLFIMVILLGIEHFISNRYHINPYIFIGILVVIFGLGTYFALVPKITQVNIKSDKISKDTKILFVTDIHVDNIMSKIHLNKIIKTIDKEKPDFVIIGGDLMNKPNTSYVKYFSLFNNVKTPIYAVMGNHDVMGGTEALNKLVQNSNIYFLFNDSIEINGISLIGLIDKSVQGQSNISDNLKSIDGSKNDKSFNILITHQPIALSKVEDYPIDLELAGHTHRGQFFGMRKVVEWMNDYGYGEYKENGKTVFVSQGIGTWGLPFRIGTQSEMVMINLTK